MGKIHLRGERPDLLVGAEGQPMPPASAVVELATIDPRLSLRFFPIAEEEGGCWCFTEAWGENDPRWASVIEGDVSRDKTYDIIGWAPRDLNGEDALGYLLQSLQKAPDSVQSAHHYIGMIQQHTMQTRRVMEMQAGEDAMTSVIEGMKL